MKPSGALAVLLSVMLPSGAFAQNYAASGAAASAESGASATAGTIQLVPSSLSITPLSLSAPAMTPSLSPVPGASLISAPSIANTRSAVVAVETIAAIPALPAALSVIHPAAAAAEPIKPAALVPAALRVASETPSAAAKSDAEPSKTWTEKLAAMFDGGAKKDEAAFDPSGLKAFIVRHGQPMTAISVDEALAHGGQVRLLTAPNDPSGVGEKDAERVKTLLASNGVKAVVSNEKLAVDWTPKTAATAAAAEASAQKDAAASKLTWPFREAKFLAKTFAASLVKPLPSEIIGGIATKSFPLVTSIGVYWAAVGLAHPFALAGLVALSLTQEIFHGIFLKSWNNFQEALSRQRGFNYQMFFNLAYMQGFGTLYRLLSWSANPKSVTPPWSVNYWQDMAFMSVVGTFFGVMGYNGLNTLYAKGSISRWQHSGIQQLRDLCFLLAGPFFASGSMTVFWGIFLFQQSLDLAIALWAGRAKARPVVFLASAPVAASPEFKAKYPAEGVALVPPLKQAVSAVAGNPLVRLMTWPVRALWKLARGGKK